MEARSRGNDSRSNRPPQHDPVHCYEALTSVFGLLGKRWTGVIVGVLLDRPARFAEMAAAIPEITEAMLSRIFTGQTKPPSMFSGWWFGASALFPC